jgi:hypothetical protein
MIAFYKANPKSTGSACSFKADTKLDSSKGVYVEFIKQISWNAEKRTGSFKGGEQAALKFSINEVGDMLNALEKNVPAFPQFNKDAGAYHKSPTGSASIRFCPYIDSKTGEQRGFSLSVSKKEDGKDKKFVIGFTFAEMVVLREFLKWTLDRIFTAQHSAEKKKFEDSQKAKKATESKSATAPKKEKVAEVEEEVESDLF